MYCVKQENASRPSYFFEPGTMDLVVHRLLGQANCLDLRILEALVAEPKRFTELKPLIGERYDHNLTVALARLARDALIERRSFLEADEVVHRYRLTPVGVEALLMSNKLQPLSQTIEQLAQILLAGRGKAAPETAKPMKSKRFGRKQTTGNKIPTRPKTHKPSSNVRGRIVSGPPARR